MNGACYWSDHNVSTTVEFDKTIPLVNRGQLIYDPGGRVVNVANWQAWGPGFDPSQSQNFLFEGIKSGTANCLSF